MKRSIAYDLRIGNYLLYKGKVIMVAGIHKKGDEINYQIKYFDIEGDKWGVDNFVRDDEVEGIPLTEEWLLKSGFSNPFIGPVYELIAQRMDQRIRIHKVGEGTFILGNYESTAAPLRYVHKLQNLYFELKGEELLFKSSTPPPEQTPPE